MVASGDGELIEAMEHKKEKAIKVLKVHRDPTCYTGSHFVHLIAQTHHRKTPLNDRCKQHAGERISFPRKTRLNLF